MSSSQFISIQAQASAIKFWTTFVDVFWVSQVIGCAAIELK